MPPTRISSKKTSEKTKKTNSKKGTGNKYADKSPGQPELIPIFDEIKKLLVPYEKRNHETTWRLGRASRIDK